MGKEKRSSHWLTDGQQVMESGRCLAHSLLFSTHPDLHDLLGSQAPNEGIYGCQIPSSHICQLPDEILIQTVLLHFWQGSSIHGLG